MNGILYVFWNLLKLGLKSKWNGKAVNIIEVYELALDGMSRNLRKSNPDDTSVQRIVEELQPLLSTARTVIDRPVTEKFDVENPVRAMRLLATSLETGIKRNFKIPANLLQQITAVSNSTELSPEQKEQCLNICCNAYLVGVMAPILQFDVFEHELSELLLETRCQTREELSRELRKTKNELETLKADTSGVQEVLKKVSETLQLLQVRDIEASANNDLTVMERHIHRLHREYNDVDNWATVPDCVEVMADMLRELSCGDNQKKFSIDAARVNIQKRLREAQVKSYRASNADFYKTIDIAAEAAKEYKRFSIEQYLIEFNMIASPHDDLQRTRKQHKV